MHFCLSTYHIAYEYLQWTENAQFEIPQGINSTNLTFGEYF